MTYERRNLFTPFTPFTSPPEPNANLRSGRERAEPSSPPANDSKAMSAAIIRAGKLRRNELVEDLRPPIGSLGRAILDAAARARGEDVK
jgi:hypothetical protein